MSEDHTNNTPVTENSTQRFSLRNLENWIHEASVLDNHWFEGDGISEENLREFLQMHSDNGLALFEGDQFRGFATFEIVESGELPQGYVGKVPYEGKYLFIQQFTTDQNYSGNMEVDKALLAEVEKRAKAARCAFVAEALAVNHPFSVERSLKERKVRHDAFGFYTEQGYQQHDNLGWRWQTENYSPEDCVLVTKVLQ